MPTRATLAVSNLLYQWDKTDTTTNRACQHLLQLRSFNHVYKELQVIVSVLATSSHSLVTQANVTQKKKKTQRYIAGIEQGRDVGVILVNYYYYVAN